MRHGVAYARMGCDTVSHVTQCHIVAIAQHSDWHASCMCCYNATASRPPDLRLVTDEPKAGPISN
jgi:hypothetical protein